MKARSGARTLTFALILTAWTAACGPTSPPPAEIVEPEPPPEPRPKTILISGEFPRNSNLQELLGGLGLSPGELHRLIRDTRSVYNLHQVRAGNSYAYETRLSGEFVSFRYDVDAEKYVRVTRDGEGFRGEMIHHELETEIARISGVIRDSLWNTLLEMDEAPTLVVRLAEILQWDVDFTAVQPGDWFKLIVEKEYKEGRFLKYGKVLALQFNSGGKDFYGFRFVTPGSEKDRYYDLKGQSLRKAFLKVPFHFSPRISSGFSYSRFHPILKKRRPHLALDFAAPYGTPVLASASGRVVFAGVKGGFGKFVQIRHANGYKTSYAHLSKILVRAGRNVQQGDVIGKVGATGLATAAHLDYRIQDPRGKFLNPRKRIAWPSDKAVDKKYWSQFTAVADSFLAELNLIPLDLPPQSGLSVAD